MHKHKGKGLTDMAEVPKCGGGCEAFHMGEACIPGVGDEDYNNVMPQEGGKTKL